MSSALVFSQCHSVVAVPNLHPISSSSSPAAHFASPDGSTSVSPNHVSRGGYRLSKRSNLRSEFGTSQIENDWKIDPSSSSFSGHSLGPQCRGRCSEVRTSENRGGAFQALDGSSCCRDSVETSVESSVQQLKRRELVGTISSWIVLPGLINASSAVGAGAAAEDDEQSPESSTIVAPPAKIGLIEKLLERSKANKAKYDQERLDAYYKRNFKDYFEFLKGTIQNKDKDNLTEAEKGILSWLEKNQ